ncbi:MAG: hypothetical protein Q9174_006356, partial [Haloplaca sp. 1 TL-2023]
MDLPCEIRTHILSFLLPDRKLIKCDTAHSVVSERPWRNSDPLTWYPLGDTGFHPRYDNDSCYPKVLQANRQIYNEGFDFLYRQRAYQINVYDLGFDFLREGMQLDELPAFPFHVVPEFKIVVFAPDTSLAQMAMRLRTNLLRLCGLLKHHNVRFRGKLTIEFTSGYTWRDAWDAEKTRGADLEEM